MAVTLSAAQLAAALRMGESGEELAQAARLLTYAAVAVTRYAPDAPNVVHDEAAIRLAGYIFDAPFAGRGDAYANAGRSSGAWAILAPYREHRGGTTALTTTAPDGTQSLSLEVTTQPTDLVAALGLDVGKTYQGQYVGPEFLNVLAASSAPSADAPATSIDVRGTFIFTPVQGARLYVWADYPGGYVVVTLARVVEVG